MSGEQQLFAINGLVDTNKGVWQNVEELAGAAASYITWDTYTQQFGVVINQPGVSRRTLTDDDIIGSVTLTETPFSDQYNSAEVSFPNRDIRDKTDVIRYDSPIADRFDYEPDNTLTLEFDFVNEPIQASVIALTELKQSRVNKVISFTTDFRQMDLDPGDIIAITNNNLAFDEKLFRIVEIKQTDTPVGEIFIDFVCVEYDSEVYNYNNLDRFERSIVSDVPTFKTNAQVQTAADETVGTQVGRALETNTGKAAITSAGVPVYNSLDSGFTTTQVDTQINGSSTFGSVLQTVALKNLQIVIEGPQATVDYAVYIDEVLTNRQYIGSVPIGITLDYSTDNISYSTIKQVYKEWTGNSHVFNVTDAAAGYYRITIEGVPTLVLDQDVPSSITTNQATIDITSIASTASPSGDAATISFITLE